MAIKLSSNPTCVLSDADNLTAEQRQKINMNLTKGIPGSDIEGDKVTVINSDGEVEMKAYSAGGGGGTSYTAGRGIEITSDTISVNVDHGTIDFNESGQLEYVGGTGGSGGYTTIDFPTMYDSYPSFLNSIEAALSSNLIPVVVYEDRVEDEKGEHVTKHVELVLSGYINTSREGPSDKEFWFVGSTFDITDGQHGKLQQIIVKAAYYGKSDSYDVTRYTTVQDNVSYESHE